MLVVLGTMLIAMAAVTLSPGVRRAGCLGSRTGGCHARRRERFLKRPCRHELAGERHGRVPGEPRGLSAAYAAHTAPAGGPALHAQTEKKRTPT
jgi:hypothetical protein